MPFGDMGFLFFSPVLFALCFAQNLLSQPVEVSSKKAYYF